METNPPHLPRRFALAVTETHDEYGDVLYDVKSTSFGISREVIITTLRNWLRLTEESHYQEFLHRQ